MNKKRVYYVFIDKCNVCQQEIYTLMKDIFGELFEAEYTYLFRKLFLFTK